MKVILDFFKSVVTGGVFIVIPFLAVFLVLGELVDLLVQYTQPIAQSLPFDEISNTTLATLIAVIEAILICFAAGLMVHTRWGSNLFNWLERTFLNKLPIYTMVKNLSRRFGGHDGVQFIPAEVDLYGSESRILGLIVEELPDERLAVFIPAAPAVTMGQLHLLPRARVKVLDASLSNVVSSISQWGLGTGKLYSKPD